MKQTVLINLLFTGVSVSGFAAPPDVCRQGFVWREAFAGDHVCITPGSQARGSE
jgi:hypothetical protein